MKKNFKNNNIGVMKCCLCNGRKKGEFAIINGRKYHYCCIEEWYLFLSHCH